MGEKITNEGLAIKIDALDKKIDTVISNQVIQNNRTFENSKDIAGMKGASGVIALIVTVIMNFLIALFAKKIL